MNEFEGNLLATRILHVAMLDFGIWHSQKLRQKLSDHTDPWLGDQMELNHEPYASTSQSFFEFQETNQICPKSQESQCCLREIFTSHFRQYIGSLVFRYSYVSLDVRGFQVDFWLQKPSNQNPYAKLQKVSPFASCQVWKKNIDWLPTGWAPPPPPGRPRWVEMASFCTPPKINKLLPQGTAQQARRGSWERNRKFAGREFFAEKQHWSVCLTTIVCQIHGCTFFIVHAWRNNSIQNPVIQYIFTSPRNLQSLLTCNVFCRKSSQPARKNPKNNSTCQPASVLQSPSHYFLEWTWHTKIPPKFSIGDGHPTSKNTFNRF